MARLAIFPALLILNWATADGASCLVWDYPIPSYNTSGAPRPAWYTLQNTKGDRPTMAGTWVGNAPHASHGLELADGSLLACGDALEDASPSVCPDDQGGGCHDAFAVKMDSAGTPLWAWGSNFTKHDDAALSCAQLPGGGDVLLGGFRQLTVDGHKIYHRVLTRLSVADGHEIWTATFPDPSSSSSSSSSSRSGTSACHPAKGSMCHGALHWIDLLPGGGGLLMGGWVHKPDGAGMMWKSGGVPDYAEGMAGVVMKLPLAALTQAGKAPTAADLSWSHDLAGYRMVVSVKALPDQGAVVLLYTPDDVVGTRVVRLGADGAGSSAWSTATTVRGQGTDIVPVVDASGAVVRVAVGGLYGAEGQGGLTGQIALLHLNGSAAAPPVRYSPCGYEGQQDHRCTVLQYTECWGLNQAGPGGALVLGCGVGIEECDKDRWRTAADVAACKRGEADKRPGAVSHHAGVWKTLVVAADPGTARIRWQRVNSHRQEGQQTAADSLSSSTEHVYVTRNGDIIGVGDETWGVGHLRLSYNQSLASA